MKKEKLQETLQHLNQIYQANLNLMRNSPDEITESFLRSHLEVLSSRRVIQSQLKEKNEG